ncbi:MAG: CARDB domain-containing protein [Patescibacteria group bacterium]
MTRTTFLAKITASTAIAVVIAFLIVTHVNAAPAATLTASSTDLRQGESVTLTWSSSDATTCTGTGFSTGGATSGSVTVTPADDTSYSVVCTKQSLLWARTSGPTATNVSGSCTAGLTQSGACPAQEGTGCATVNATCTTTLRDPDAGFCRTTRTTYTCQSQTQSATASASVTVRDVSVTLTSNPGTVSSGGAATLSWNVTGATTCTSSGFNWANQMSGSTTVNPTDTTSYSLICNNGTPVVSGTWRYKETDTSDLACSNVNSSVCQQYGNNHPNLPYGAMTTCSPGNPSGTSCTQSGALCKNGYWDHSANQAPYMTDIYQCSATGSTGSSDADSASVTVTQVPDLVGQVGGAAATNTNQPVTLYGGVANEGAGAAGYFPNLIQICDTNCTTVNQTIAATAASSLASGGWQEVSASYTPSTQGQQFYRVCANNNTSWVNVHTESNYANNCSGWQYLTVGTPAPDLTAGAITPNTASRGQTRTLSATITNIGGAAAGASTGYFQLTAPVSKQSTTASPSVSTIPPSGSAPTSFSYTFQTAGTYSVRLCADWSGVVAESNEGNNCGPWTDVSVSEAPVGSSVSCSVNTQSAVVGGSVTYTASPVAAATWPYGWLGSDGATGFGSESTATRTFTDTGSYGMQVTATNAATPAQCPLVTVGAGWCTGGTPTLTITATPARVRTGQTSSVTWSATGVNGQNADCTVTGPGISWSSAVSAVPVCSASGSATVTISTQSTYTLTCDNAQPKTATVNVIPNFQEF